jgi:hypothetical protein
MASSEEQQPEPRDRGLPSVQQAREARASGKTRWPSVKFWAYCALVLAVGFILRWKWEQGETESKRQKLMAMQRDLAAGDIAGDIGKRWVSFRDKVERWTLDLAKSPVSTEVIDKEALKSWDFRDRPGVYLRLRAEDAQTVESIRAGARTSLKDAFTSCLMRVPNPLPTAGPDCKRTRDCPKGQHCNETDHCSFWAQPLNLRDAYRTMRVISEERARDVQETDDDRLLKEFIDDVDDAIRYEFPLAIDLLQHAQYFLLVVDEPVANMPKLAADAGVTPSEAIQGVPHHARVAVYRLSDDKQILQVRREASGEAVGMTTTLDPAVLAARQRQLNSCQLAQEVRQAMGDASGIAAPPQQ